MKSKYQIEFDFQQAMQYAAELDEISGEMGGMARGQVQNTIDTISAAWQGENALLYLGKANQLREDISTTARDLAGIAETIRKIARIMRDAELQAIQIATIKGN